MRYHLGVEDIEPDHRVAWVFELPGCFASARTQTEAVAAAPARIAAYFRWLAMYGHSMPGVDAHTDTGLASSTARRHTHPGMETRTLVSPQGAASNASHTNAITPSSLLICWAGEQPLFVEVLLVA
jgi:hypothetical protein